MIVLQLAAGLLLAAAAYFAVRSWTLDVRMQRFRTGDASAAAYLFVPLRWQRRLYTPEAHPLVSAAWRAVGAMYALAVAGGLLLAITLV